MLETQFFCTTGREWGVLYSLGFVVRVIDISALCLHSLVPAPQSIEYDTKPCPLMLYGPLRTNKEHQNERNIACNAGLARICNEPVCVRFVTYIHRQRKFLCKVAV